MRFGAHVSSSGGISKAIGRGRDLGCESLQVFTHNPRTWRPINHKEEEIAAFRAGAAEAGMGPLVSHGLYLINLGAPDREVPTGPARQARDRHAQHLPVVGGEPGAAPRRSARPSAWRGSSCTSAPPRGRTRARPSSASAPGIAEALEAGPGDCAVFLENTAGAGDTIGRTFAQLRAVFDAVGHPARLGFCLDSQHLFASGYPVHEPGGIDRVLEEFDQVVGLDRLRCLHLNDSKVAFASNRDRHENLGDGEIGEDGMRRILGRPDLQGLPVILEVPGLDGQRPRPREHGPRAALPRGGPGAAEVGRLRAGARRAVANLTAVARV